MWGGPQNDKMFGGNNKDYMYGEAGTLRVQNIEKIMHDSLISFHHPLGEETGDAISDQLSLTTVCR